MNQTPSSRRRYPLDCRTLAAVLYSSNFFLRLSSIDIDTGPPTFGPGVDPAMAIVEEDDEEGGPDGLAGDIVRRVGVGNKAPSYRLLLLRHSLSLLLRSADFAGERSRMTTVSSPPVGDFEALLSLNKICRPAATIDLDGVALLAVV